MAHNARLGARNSMHRADCSFYVEAIYPSSSIYPSSKFNAQGCLQHLPELEVQCTGLSAASTRARGWEPLRDGADGTFGPKRVLGGGVGAAPIYVLGRGTILPAGSLPVRTIRPPRRPRTHRACVGNVPLVHEQLEFNHAWLNRPVGQPRFVVESTSLKRATLLNELKGKLPTIAESGSASERTRT
eukprot:283800-Chlamydomonas_euryale.AAC.4